MHQICTATAASPRVIDPPAVLSARGLGKRYGDRRVIWNLSFNAVRGECLALLGPSGAGKTTLIRCMAGLLHADEGEVVLHGASVHMLSRQQRRKIAVVFQQFNLVGRLTALDNVLAGRLGHLPVWRGLLRRFDRSDRLLAFECLDRVGLLTLASQRADKLSGGQQQRVAIARALAQRPDVILADEPIASLDPPNATEVLKLLRQVCDTDGVTVICSLHQFEFARRWADRILGLNGGSIAIDAAAIDVNACIGNQIYGAPATAGVAHSRMTSAEAMVSQAKGSPKSPK